MIKNFIYTVVITIFMFSISLCSYNSGRKSGNKLQISNTQTASICNNSLYDYCVKVTKIVDGDTFHGLTKENEQIKFRVYGIDAPERTQAFANRSRQHFSDLIFEKTVGIKVQTKRDRYGRPIVWVYTDDGKDVGLEMLKAGMAWHYKEYDSSPEYDKCEREAREARIGLWVDNNPVAPWDFRRKK